MDKDIKIDELKKQIEVLKEELKEKEEILNGLLDMLYEDSEEEDNQQ